MEITIEVEQATVFTSSGREAQARAGVATGQAVARGVAFARDLVNSPGYAMTPERLGDEAVSRACLQPLEAPGKEVAGHPEVLTIRRTK
jgi:leucyl aminopeptidase